MNDPTLRIRLHPSIKEEAKKIAKERDVTLSEFVRDLIRREIIEAKAA